MKMPKKIELREIVKALVTVADLADFLKKEGLAIAIRFTRCEWVATIEWAYPDYSTANATARAASMLEAVTKCLADYYKQTSGVA